MINNTAEISYVNPLLPYTKETKMKILLFDESEITYERVKRLIGHATDHVDEIRRISSLDNILIDAYRMKPEIIILNTYFLRGSILETIRVLKTISPKCQIISLVEFSDPVYQNLLTEAGSDYFIDLAQNFEDIPEILQKFKTRSPSGMKIAR